MTHRARSPGASCALAVAILLLAAIARGAGGAPADGTLASPEPATPYRGRPIYSEPSMGLQLPPGCEVDPSWRAPLPGGELEVWIARCDATARVWLVRRQVLEVLNARQTRLRFEVLDERVVAGEDAGETVSVQCSGMHDESGFVVLGARWRPEGRQLRLRSARAVLRGDTRGMRLVDAEIGQVDCIRFPEREAMMKRLQQGGR
jgi:hypothetical protein